MHEYSLMKKAFNDTQSVFKKRLLITFFIIDYCISRLCKRYSFEIAAKDKKNCFGYVPQEVSFFSKSMPSYERTSNVESRRQERE